MKIAVATEDSVPAFAAIRFAARLAAATHGSLVVLSVDSRFPHALAGSGGLDRRLASALNEAARISTANTFERARKEGALFGVRVRCESTKSGRVEPIAQTLSRAAERERADLVVVESPAGIGRARWALGSFASQLVHVVRRPIAVVPDTYRDPKGRVAKILVATDGSGPSLEAVRLGARLAARIPRARLVILTVSTLAADVALTGPRVVTALGLLPLLRQTDRGAARRILDSAAREARRFGARAMVRYHAPRKRTFAEQAVAAEAARERADVIVLGNSGRSALGDVLLGSVARGVVSLARRPVILVRAHRGGPTTNRRRKP